MSDATISRRFVRVLPGVHGDGDPEFVDVIVSRRTRTPPWLHAHEGSARSAFLSDLRVTTPARTVVDCAADLNDGAAGKLVDECIAAGLTVSAVRAELRRGVRHSARVRRLIDTVARNVASEPERLLIRALAGRGYRLEANARVGQFVVDLLDRRARLIVEVDGLEFHSAPDVFHRARPTPPRSRDPPTPGWAPGAAAASRGRRRDRTRRVRRGVRRRPRPAGLR